MLFSNVKGRQPSVVLEYNLLTPHHMYSHCTEQHYMPFIWYFLNPTMHGGIWVSWGNQSHIFSVWEAASILKHLPAPLRQRLWRQLISMLIPFFSPSHRTNAGQEWGEKTCVACCNGRELIAFWETCLESGMKKKKKLIAPAHIWDGGN